MYDQNQAHYVVVTGILVKNGRYLIAKRADWEKAFPGRWTVSGGKLKTDDYYQKEKDTSQHWYNVFEEVVRREIMEEVGLEIENIGYVTSMVYERSDKIPCIIVSLYAEPKNKDDEVKLCEALSEFAWVDIEEAKKYDLIEGIYDELVMLDDFLKTGKHMKWDRNK